MERNAAEREMGCLLGKRERDKETRNRGALRSFVTNAKGECRFATSVQRGVLDAQRSKWRNKSRVGRVLGGCAPAFLPTKRTIRKSDSKESLCEESLASSHSLRLRLSPK
jgi:hypothetical protein